MSQLGQYRRIGTLPTLPACPLSPRSLPNFSDRAKRRSVPLPDLSRCSKVSKLLDHLVGCSEQFVRHREAEHPGGLGVDNQLELA
jgi:hypothetical protein